jgi:outer membrane protein OmpA-like peptidoglycan-associated protein
MKLRGPILAACGLLSIVWHSSAFADAAGPQNCWRLTGGTLTCTNVPADNAPPNTERSAPSSPPSGARVKRLVAAVATVPKQPPSNTLQLFDTVEKANFASGSDELTTVAVAKLDAFAASLRAAHALRILVTAHTDSQRLVRQARKHFGTNQRLSEARAARVVEYLEGALSLPESAFAIQGFGESRPLARNDTEAGRALNRRAEVFVWVQEPPPPPPVPAPPPPPELTATSSCIGDAANQVAPVRITVDGVPLDRREGANEADRQRCVDVALARADIQVRYDPLEQKPSLNTLAIPQLGVVGKPVRFTTYSNYSRYIDHAEVRLFPADQSVQQKPLAVVPVHIGGWAEWVPPPFHDPLLHFTASLAAPHYVTYVLRVYDRHGHFDETKPRRLDLANIAPVPTPDSIRLAEDTERLAYGDNTLVMSNIPVHGGAVTVSGSNVPPGDAVTVLGMPVPVDNDHHFVARQIVPAGPQQVNVNILNDRGEGLEFSRNLTVASDDSFFVGIADITAGAGSVSGPIELVTGDPNLARRDFVNGELAFYYKGLVKGQWLLTAAADTQNQPIKDLFSNFSSKDPEYLLRRIDPDRYYPVYGDDATTVQDAPTSGKFYVRLEKGDSSILWGDFQSRLTGTDFIQYARTLYGLNVRYRSPETTSFGEKQRSVDAFWAQPGTLASRQEFRGTGGSLYYLQNQDISVGSEQLWVQVRDRDSGLVLSVTQLVPAQDYDINYLQGRILLHSPLGATDNVQTFVHSSQLDGDPVYLVVTYEYSPDFSSVSSLSVGGHASEWFGDHVELGISDFHQGDPGEQQELRGVDGTYRYKAGTYIKSEYAYSDGVGSPTLTSITGGLSFNPVITNGSPASAERVETSVDLSEVTDSMKGRITAYYEDRGANFSGPGQLTPGMAVHQDGGSVNVPLDAATQVAGKYDSTDSGAQSLTSGELGVEHKLDEHWRVAVGARVDDRENVIANASPTLSENGRRSDVAVTVGYQPSPGKVLPVGGEIPGTQTRLNTAFGARPGAAGASPPGAADPAVNYGAASAGATASAAATPSAAAIASAPAASSSAAAASTPATASTPAASSAPAASSTPGAAAGAAAAARPPWDVYGFVQDTVQHTGTRPENDRAGLGGNYQLTDAARVGAEASDGGLGFGGKVSTDYRIDDRSNVYVNYTLAADQPDAFNDGRSGTLTTGTRYRYSDATSLYGEERMQTGSGSDSLTRAYGVDFTPNKQWSYGLKFEHGTISDPLAGDILLTAVGVTVQYSKDKIKYGGALEYRNDDSTVNTAAACGSTAASSAAAAAEGTTTSCATTTAGTGTTVAGTTTLPNGATTLATGASHTVLTRNSLSYQVDPDWRLFGKLNWSQTDAAAGSTLNAAYHEIVVGAAWRPVLEDRWNVLFKFTILDDEPSAAQVSSLGNTIDYAQQSRVADIDAMYQTTSWLSLGFKYAIRNGDLKPTETVGNWFASEAQLWIARADVLVVREWDGMLELRRLSIHETDDERSGALVGIYRHMGNNLKIGAGYNFTDYSDNLTDVSYRRQGFFLNTIGKF